MVLVEGAIEVGVFRVTTLGKSVVLQTVSTAEDSRGPYALLEKGKYRLDTNTLLTVDVDRDALLGNGTRIAVHFDGHVQGFSVYFDAAGRLDGTSSAHPGSASAPPPLH